ncbi:MAG: hypothetical protein KBA51_08335 [Kiritimatiellae bacterium]|nr:hypothetical protein [Kiritimatiellia bacterium]
MVPPFPPPLVRSALRRFRARPSVFSAMAALLLSMPAVASEDSAESTEPESPPRSNHILVRARDSMSATLVQTAERVDRFFGDERLEDDNQGTRLTVRFGLREQRREGLSFEHKISLRLDLPQLDNRWQLVVDNFVEGDDPGDPAEVRAALADSRPDTGLRWILRELDDFRFTADAGARWSDDPQLFLRLRARKTWMFNDWELRASQILFAYTADGVGERSELRWQRRWGSHWIFRSTSRATWRDQESGIEPQQSFEVFSTPKHCWAQAFRISGEWPNSPRTRRARYAGEWVVRRRMYSDWLFVEVRPGVEFSQLYSFHDNPYIMALLEVMFGDSP